jgi:UDP-glucose 4-epimerase
MFGLNYIIFRPHNVYGEHQNIGDHFRNVVGIFIRQMLNSEPLTIFGDGNQTRAFSYISDVAPHIASSVHVKAAYNETMNIGADTICTVNEVAAIVGAAFGTAPVMEYLSPRQEVKHAYPSHAKATNIFGPKATESLETGVRRMAEWARHVGVRGCRSLQSIEIANNLPPAWQRCIRQPKTEDLLA